MSYSFGMFFVECKPKKVLDKCLDVTNIITDNAEAYIKDNDYFLPSNRYSIDQKHIARELDRFWLYSLFNFKFIYWEKYNLLGFCGYNYGKQVEKAFTHHIGFQNSTDQDYEYACWQGIDCFDKIISEVNDMNTQQILTYLNREYSDYTEEDIDKNISYYKRSIVYNKIYEMLDLDSWLWGKDGNFKRITMCGIDSQETHMKLQNYLSNQSDWQ